ncbi:Hydroquinone glucosyltransferase [Sesamum alatum]|uniref:Glycosyltransferase n=1 Tax=Sesamum alatum TaxID=300844 RepID=A0AAE1Y851_9LAMI|nr:Hydroquinone glucosyltransferase [Sesamum alatum]
METSQAAAPPHIAILPSPGMGHLIPLAELAKNLVSRHSFSVTFIIPSDANTSHLQAQKSFLQALPYDSINCIFLPPISFTDLPHDTKIESRISLSVNQSLPHLRRALITLHESGTRLSALVVDILGVFAVDVAREFSIPPYIFFFSNAMALSLVLHLPELDEVTACEYKDLLEPVRLPGCIPLKGKDLPDHFQDRANEAYKFALEKCKKYQLADGIIVNSFLDLEPGTFKALKDEGCCKVPVYPIGPMIQTGSGSNSSSDCLKWLDEQPDGSVLYVSFGSGGTLSHDQLIELAVGLEMSGQRFLWVVKSPDEKAANAAFFSVESVADPLDFLPRGFLERTKNRGLMVSSWAPQNRVLAHRSTGGFLTHCGWNSCLDGITNGVPLIAWPLFAEQRMNAALLTEGLKVSLRVEANEENGIVDREQIARLVRGLIGSGEEGIFKDVGNRIRVLKDAAAKAWSHAGSSEKALGELAHKWTIQV